MFGRGVCIVLGSYHHSAVLAIRFVIRVCLTSDTSSRRPCPHNWNLLMAARLEYLYKKPGFSRDEFDRTAPLVRRGFNPLTLTVAIRHWYDYKASCARPG